MSCLFLNKLMYWITRDTTIYAKKNITFLARLVRNSRGARITKIMPGK